MSAVATALHTSRRMTDLLRAAIVGSPTLTRLEPQSISGDPTPGLEARIHDPLWLLTRQWQLGEFDGEDAGSPLLVEVRSSAGRVTAWQPGDPTAARPAIPIDPLLPLDPGIEREATPADRLGLRERAEAGRYLLELLGDAGLTATQPIVAACPLPIAPAAPPPGPPGGQVPAAHVAVPVSMEIIASTTPDGASAAAQLEGAAPGVPPWLTTASAAAKAAAQTWLAWFRASLAPRPVAGATDSWIPDRLEYHFSIRIGAGTGQRVFAAPIHEGGEIDWFAFDEVANVAINAPGDPATEAPVQSTLTMIAKPLRYGGMPPDRYWQFEDGQVNLGRLDAQPHDLAHLCVAEFAMIYGNDWLLVPLTVTAGSFVTITQVKYTTTFGETFTVNPAADQGGSGAFRMFGISRHGDETQSRPGMLIPPTTRGTIEGKPLEEVLFLRDEMANMAWAVERLVQARSGEARSRGDEPRPINRVEEMDPAAQYQYLLRTQTPAHWIPMVPIATGIGEIALRKGTMTDVDQSMGVLLAPTPFTLRDEEVPREGVIVRRVPSLARGADGRYLRWISRRANIGRGEGWSGLAFDGAYKP